MLPFDFSMSYPLPVKKIKAFAKKVKKLYVMEELEPFLEEQLSRRDQVVGKKVLALRELSLTVRQIVANRIELRHPKNPCVRVMPGCPHRRLYALKKGSISCGDIVV